ncbi:MAG: hypothetical protein KAQ71_01795, partial [Desulfobulbaceae bacterium]|nr:hypothetical protein [Desulfobulbaceae bacterium]
LHFFMARSVCWKAVETAKTNLNRSSANEFKIHIISKSDRISTFLTEPESRFIYIQIGNSPSFMVFA